MARTVYRPTSLWHDSLPEGEPRPRPPLDGSVDVDVAIIGAGYTGLWSAYYLSLAQPDLSIAVVESEIAGFGASGRNGGWVSGELALQRRRVAARLGTGAVATMMRAVWDSIDEIGRVTKDEGIECHFAKGGTITLATSAAQVQRLRHHLADQARFGFGEADFRWLDRQQTADRVRSDKAIGSVYSPHCGVVHPGRLVRGLATAVERRGVRIYERTTATLLEPGRVVTTTGVLRAGAVLDCMEAFRVKMPHRRREVAPVYSLMVATEPLPDSVWDEIGLTARETFADGRHLVIYGQRTADGRLAFGGRGAPYHFRSGMRPEFERDPHTHRTIADLLTWLLPQAAGAAITHTWGGAVAVPRDWSSHVGFDPVLRMGSAGGYVGAGVSPSNLAGRTLADLTGLPWVGHEPRRWEPEPLRWMGINLVRALAPAADAAEFRSGRPSRLAGTILDRLTGH
jgi:glycine/D-amino acid oxidase-like deaminating enzyme